MTTPNASRGSAYRLAASILSALVLLLALIGFVKSAHAHGDAQWIADGGYTDRNGVHCCGENDCHAAAPGEIVPIAGGWRHVPTATEILTADGGVYPSERFKLFACIRGGDLKCVFPVLGA